MINKTDQWNTKQPDAYIGILVIKNVLNLPNHPDLDAARRSLEIELRERYGSLDRKTLRELPVYKAYDAFYRPFKKTYHVQLQLESILLKSKSIFSPSTLVACMFMAELNTGLLTAAHDFNTAEFPLIADIASGDEVYLRLDNTEQTLKEGDLYIKDQQGILSSIIYGPDKRTRIRMDTDQALFTTYGIPGISKEQVYDQLVILEEYIRTFAPQAIQRDLIVI